MKKSRTFELILVLLVVAFVVSRQSQDPAPTEVQTQPAPATRESNLPLRIGDAVPGFTLKDENGQGVAYRSGEGPILIVLTATGCGECLQRIATEDEEAFQLAKDSGLEVWNLLVFQSPEGASSFVEKHQPRADRILSDPSSSISVKTLGGSDSTCWLVIDGQGKLAYRGPVDTDALEKALKAL